MKGSGFYEVNMIINIETGLAISLLQLSAWLQVIIALVANMEDPNAED